MKTYTVKLSLDSSELKQQGGNVGSGDNTQRKGSPSNVVGGAVAGGVAGGVAGVVAPAAIGAGLGVGLGAGSKGRIYDDMTRDVAEFLLGQQKPEKKTTVKEKLKESAKIWKGPTLKGKAKKAQEKGVKRESYRTPYKNSWKQRERAEKDEAKEVKEVKRGGSKGQKIRAVAGKAAIGLAGALVAVGTIAGSLAEYSGPMAIAMVKHDLAWTRLKMAAGNMLAPAMNWYAEGMEQWADWLAGGKKSIGVGFGDSMVAYLGTDSPEMPDPLKRPKPKPKPPKGDGGDGAHGPEGKKGKEGPGGNDGDNTSTPIPTPVATQNLYLGMQNNISAQTHIDDAILDLRRNLLIELNRSNNQTDMFLNEIKSINYIRSL